VTLIWEGRKSYLPSIRDSKTISRGGKSPMFMRICVPTCVLCTYLSAYNTRSNINKIQGFLGTSDHFGDLNYELRSHVQKPIFA
jgi:hypothetical protein